MLSRPLSDGALDSIGAADSPPVPDVLVPPPLELHRRLPRFATVGEPVTYPVVVRNPGTRAVAGLALMENYADPRPSF